MVDLGVVLGMAIGFMIVCSVFLRWNDVKYRKKGLPPGTMGWPLFGETTEFLKQGPNFMKKQRARYGNIFKTHILGCPTVICMDPELNRSIIMNESMGLIPGYPQSMLDILGKWNIAAIHGSLHKAMRSCMLGLISPTMIRDQLLSKIDEFTRSFINNWDGQVIDIQEKMKEMWLFSILKQIVDIDSSPLAGTLKSEIMKLVLGSLSLPINFPGTSYYQGIQARRKIVNILKKIIYDRRTSQRSNGDMLDALLRKDDNAHAKLTDEQIIDLIITLVYSGFETVSITSMMSVKYLHDHPSFLKELRNEHMGIRKKKLPEDAIDWEDYKSMNFTRAVILETLRLATVVNGLLRKTTQDMEMNGFVIPKGWKIYVYTREINYDAFMHPEPLNFNPCRWMEKNLESHQYFMAFGGGGRLCPGKELGTVQIAVFLHYFVTRYRWKEVGRGKLLKFPRVEAPNGLHIRIWDN
ncbi:cytochrome P450 85A1-like isoform X1 [Typha angustifolia]|uniref:cytochrome P450 85A1-like isoform X1 n=1 Tax=Typha angustifolia TaxID=59011 RepID=UPI003C2BB53D